MRDSTPPAAPQTAVPWVEIAVVLLVALACGLPSLSLPLGRDHGIGLYIGEVIAGGGAPYVDAWDIKPPGVLYLNALVSLVLGKHPWSLRLFDLLWQAATALSLLALGRRWFGNVTGLTAGLLYPAAYFFGHDFWHLANFDAFLALPMTLTLLCLSGTRRTTDLLAGLLVGLVFLARFTHGLLFLPVIAWLLWPDAEGGAYAWKPRLQRFGFVCGGFFLPVAAFLLHMLLTGGFGEFFYTLFVFAPQYAVTTASVLDVEFWRLLRRVFGDFIVRHALTAVPGLLAALSLVAAKKRDRRGVTVVVWLLATFVGFAIMGKFFAYHWLPLFAPLALLAGLFVQWIADLFRERRRAWAIAGIVVFVAAAGLFLWRVGDTNLTRAGHTWNLAIGRLDRAAHLRSFDSVDQGGDFSATANYGVAAYLRDHTEAEDGVFVWGFEQLIYYLSDRRPPTRFCSNFALSAAWRPAAWVRELEDDLRRRPPAYVVLVTQDVMPWVTGHGLDSLGILRRDFRTLAEWISHHYDVETQIGNMLVCRRRGP